MIQNSMANGQSIPISMQHHRQFVVWKLVQRSGDPKPSKVPYNPITGEMASTTDPTTWTDWTTALQAVRRGGYNGVGFVFTPNDPFIFIDIDDCLTPSGDWLDYATNVVTQRLPGVSWEVSQSGHGLHGIALVADKAAFAGKRNKWTDAESGGKFECYSHSRFMAIGQGNWTLLELAASADAALLAWLPDRHTAQTGVIDWDDTAALDWEGPGDDAALLEKMLKGRSSTAMLGHKASFSNLWNGDPQVLGQYYPDPNGASLFDHSSAEQALANALAWWTGKNPARMERLMLQAPLCQRGKWQSRADYRRRTICKAIADCRSYRIARSAQVIVGHADSVDFWATFNADDGAKTSAVVCMKTMVESGIPLGHDEFADKMMIMDRVVWDVADVAYPREWCDNDTHGCKAVLEMSFIKPSKDTVFDSAHFIARRNKFHPVRDYLASLDWDSLLRLPTLAARYLGADDTPYTRIVAVKYMISAVARVMRPGCKVDTMLILEGEQGAQKSSALRALAGDDWFTDQMPDLSSKDASIQLRGKWIVEFGELDRMNRAEVTAVKSYASRQVDTYRPPYGRTTVDMPRQCVFAGTTNETEYLPDQTGNRRYWPVKCGEVDLNAIRRDRDQLWAEAVHRFDAGETWWLSEEEDQIARAEQDDRRERSPWEQRLAARLCLASGSTVTMEQSCSILEIPFDRQNPRSNKKVAAALTAIGFKRKQVRADSGRSWVYEKV